jgi:ubiquinone/menaquinone biosynthesis C-methylase UbiE
MSSPPAAPTNDQVIGRWNRFAQLYTDNLSTWSMQSTQTLLSNMQLGTGTALMECACGPGHMIKHTRQMLAPEARYVTTDYSEEMVKLATRHYTNGVGAEDAHTNVCLADAQQLPEEYTGQFDRYLANLCLVKLVHLSRPM